jgi:hypothetical protein
MSLTKLSLAGNNGDWKMANLLLQHIEQGEGDNSSIGNPSFSRQWNVYPCALKKTQLILATLCLIFLP